MAKLRGTEEKTRASPNDDLPAHLRVDALQRKDANSLGKGREQCWRHLPNLYLHLRLRTF